MCVGELRAAPPIGIKPVPSWVVPVTPGGKAPSAKDISGGYYLSFVDKQVNLGVKSTYQRFVRQIVSESGIQNGSEISVTFDPAYERVDFHEVTVWRAGQRISHLKQGDFKVMPVESERQRFIYNGYHSASLVLKDIRKGDRIDVAYSTTGWNPVFMNKYSDFLYFNAYDYIAHIHNSILSPAGRVLHFKDFNKPPVRNNRNAGGNVLYEWNALNVKNNSYDDNVPGWYGKEPLVQVTEFGTWKEVVDWGLNFYQVPAPAGALKAKVDEWKAQSESTLEFIGKAVRFVQDEIRYLGIETGENSHRPHKPEDVFAQRYGDCKDKVFLLCAILRSNGIECDPVLVDSYKRSHVDENLPSPPAFNHVIARVRVQEKSGKDNEFSFAFIDATMALQGGAVPQMYCPPYGKGLLLQSGQAHLVTIPDHNPGNVDIVEDIYLPASGDSTAEGSIQVKTAYYKGDADDFRAQFQEGDVSEMEEHYLNFYKDLFKHAVVEATDTLEYYDQREGNSFSLVERYSLKNPWKLDSATNKFYFDVFGKTLYTTLNILPGRPRKDPVSLKFPSEQNYTINVHMPDARTILADQWEIKRGSYIISFESKYLPQEYTWQLKYHFKTLKDHVPVSEAKQFKADMDKLVENLEYQLTEPKAGGFDLSDINGWMVGLLIAVGIFAVTFFKRLYQYSPGYRHYHESETILGGWLILLAISVGFAPMTLLFQFVGQQLPVYVSLTHWNVMEAKGVLISTAYRGLLVFELCFNGAMIGYAVLVAVLFFKKRDSFPILYIYYLGINLLGVILDACLTYALVGDRVAGELNNTIVSIGRVMFFSAIWIPYLIKSSRVQRTFVNTYGDQPVERELSEGAEVAEPLE
ncbi:transglutaminase superfamily protein [Dyadobacter jiangsuensis]|uniref:Transglutaminase superfamily protein n=1 Tax=Dyadobacter jiangsuensis TaxID=1591085 RepID=A0A2P8FSK1_9BACT|nr:transglutaminase superfamily protein [Dyadobacter jiangsuensis]